MSFKVAKELFGATIHYSEAYNDETPEAYKISDEEEVAVLPIKCYLQ